MNNVAKNFSVLMHYLETKFQCIFHLGCITETLSNELGTCEKGTIYHRVVQQWSLLYNTIHHPKNFCHRHITFYLANHGSYRFTLHDVLSGKINITIAVTDRGA